MKLAVKKNLLIIVGIALLSIPTILHNAGFTKPARSKKPPRHIIFPYLKPSRLLTAKTGEKSISDSISLYYSEMAGFKEFLLPVFMSIKNHIFNVSPYPGKVVYGREGWLFLGDDNSKVISESKGLINFTDKELNKILINMLNVNEYCRQRNIQFYMAFAPDKSDIYGNLLPIFKTDRPTKLDQVTSCLSKSGIKIINLGRDFGKYKDRRLYLKTNSHWNQFGMFIGYQSLMKEIQFDFSKVTILNIEQFVLDTIQKDEEDLTRMISLKRIDQEVLLTPKYRSISSVEKNKITIPKGYTLNPKLFEHRFSKLNRNYKALVFHDSFFEFISKFMKENFKESVFLYSSFNYRLIDDEKPDIIIYELAGREVDVLLQEHVIL
ncbi:MAG: alginate O-acetyltransferase AlgX-related protein [Bacteroidales bacterium]